VILASQEFKDMAAVLEKHMRGREFVAGEHLTVADLVMAYTLDWANEARLLGDFPRLRDYVERMYARPSAPPPDRRGVRQHPGLTREFQLILP
jgi:glutathione S-transferase